jgi:hypothetical protein
MRRLSHFLLTVEAIALVFLTVIACIFLLGGSTDVWATAWAGRGYSDALTWTAMLLSLVAAWWLLLAYFYQGHRGARQVPAAVWVFAGLITLLALFEAVASGTGSSPAILFVPTFIHLSAEVWLWPPNTSLERRRER